MPRNLFPLLVIVLALGVTVEMASAHTISKRAALAKAGKVAKRAGAQTNAVLWFAGQCRRRSAHKVVCWGGVAYADGEGCIQKVVVTSRGHSRRLSARRTGRPLCGQVPSDSTSGTGGGGGSPVVCAIRQSVCI